MIIINYFNDKMGPLDSFVFFHGSYRFEFVANIVRIVMTYYHQIFLDTSDVGIISCVFDISKFDVTRGDKMYEYEANFDGSSRGNPGPSQIGWTISKNNKVLYSESLKIDDGTNNVAEYKALIDLLRNIVNKKIDNILIRGDSNLVINQVSGNWKIKKDHLKILAEEANSYLKKIPNYKLEWVPRDKNESANKLAQS